MREEELKALRLRDKRGREILDPSDRKGFKNIFIDLIHKEALKNTGYFKKNKILLDFGCGAGRFTGWASKLVSQVIALDLDSHLLKIAKNLYYHPNIIYILYKGDIIPLKEESIDLILCAGVLTKRALAETTIEKIIGEFYRVLKRNGKLFVINKVFRRENIGFYRRKELINFFKDSGFFCIKCYSIRKGHSPLVYLAKYGFIPESHLPKLAKIEVKIRRRQKEAFFDYKDFLFQFEKS
jgi:SAM-dependent methyltransferase